LECGNGVVEPGEVCDPHGAPCAGGLGLCYFCVACSRCCVCEPISQCGTWCIDPTTYGPDWCENVWGPGMPFECAPGGPCF
jgi:hypothetical protein